MIWICWCFTLVVALGNACQEGLIVPEAAFQRFKAAFPFLTGYNSSQVQHVVTAEGDYVGEVNCTSGFRRRHGWGEMRWANGTLYGPGNIFIYSQGDRYFGQWRSDRQEGIGTFESRTGIYVGSWRAGLQNGNGTAIYHNGNRYDGSFVDGFKHGVGKFVVSTMGDVYEGAFERGVRHGQGIESYGLTGETYVGDFVNDTRWGLGTAYYQDGGPKYIGPWVQGNPQGNNGTLFLQNGQKYVGNFVQGRPSGMGILYDADGSVLKEGNFGSNDGEEGLSVMPKMALNFTNNKYANLIKKIGSLIQDYWPFR